MDIRVSGKNMTVTEGMKEHLRSKLVKFEKYAPRLVESHVVFKKEKYFFIAEVTLTAKNLRAYGEGTSKESMFTAIDQACSHVEKQLKKFREKIKDHHQQAHAAVGAKLAALVSSQGPVETPEIIQVIPSRAFVSPKPMFPEDASIQLRESQKPFLVFKNAVTQKLNVIFKREDGHHGLVEPGF